MSTSDTIATSEPEFSVVGSVRHVADSYRRFVLSTYRLANDWLAGAVRAACE